MLVPSEQTRVSLAVGATDRRQQLDGWAAWGEEVLEQDPFSASLCVFCHRGRDKLKILLWQHNGFWLWYRRLERERFRWPQSAAAALEQYGADLFIKEDAKRELGKDKIPAKIFEIERRLLLKRRPR